MTRTVWHIIRESDGKPVAEYGTSLEAEMAAFALYDESVRVKAVRVDDLDPAASV